MSLNLSLSSSAVCIICQKEIIKSDMFPVAMLTPLLRKRLLRDHPNLHMKSLICMDDLNCCQVSLMEEYLSDEVGVLTFHDLEIFESLKTDRITPVNPSQHYERSLTLGQQIADKISIIAGSWTFIIGFIVFLFAWMAINSGQIWHHPFDPYPYILLNLVLSCLAAIQAPIILMSQNRQAQRDRIEAENDYHINMISELQIRHLHEKLDILLKAQWEKDLKKQKN
jgi:uncharacterized membrane protein